MPGSRVLGGMSALQALADQAIRRLCAVAGVGTAAVMLALSADLARAVQAGDAGIVAVVAGDTNGPASFADMLPAFSRFSQDAAYPYGSGGPNGSFALLTDRYMRRYGATREDFGRICVAQNPPNPFARSIQ